MAAQPGKIAVRQKVFVDRDFDEQRPGDVDHGLQQDRDAGRDDLKFVGRQIAQQAAHQVRVVYLADNIVVGPGRFFFRFGFGGFGRHRR